MRFCATENFGGKGNVLFLCADPPPLIPRLGQGKIVRHKAETKEVAHIVRIYFTGNCVHFCATP
jgi:hypothetical protein